MKNYTPKMAIIAIATSIPELKIITLEPDRIVLLGADQETEALLAGLRPLLAPQVCIQSLHPAVKVDESESVDL